MMVPSSTKLGKASPEVLPTWIIARLTEGIWKTIRLGPGEILAQLIASRKVPIPSSAVEFTIIVPSGWAH